MLLTEALMTFPLDRMWMKYTVSYCIQMHGLSRFLEAPPDLAASAAASSQHCSTLRLDAPPFPQRPIAPRQTHNITEEVKSLHCTVHTQPHCMHTLLLS